MDNIQANTVIELIVNNHPGVMSHITGLFSRRGFNLEGILCGEIGNGTQSRMYLLVKNDHQLEQIRMQLEKLYDVMEVSVREDYDHTIFNRLHELVCGPLV
ncbi:MAG: acetolactate synthase small subunit [Chitinispirillaceae bacterium]